jgi:phosphoglycolate phosphatase-like HAD superfamily hydrolase
MKAVAIDLLALGDTEPLWRDWLDDARRRFRVEGDDLERELPNWRQLLERFAEDRAPVYFRRDAEVTRALRRLQAGGTRVGVFSAAPVELARIALSHLGAERRVEVLESGAGARERVLERIGANATVVSTRDELLAVT